MRARSVDRQTMNYNLIKRARPGQPKCVLDYPCLIDRNPVQLLPFTPNCVTSTQALGPNTILDNVETAFMKKMTTGFRICKCFCFYKNSEGDLLSLF